MRLLKPQKPASRYAGIAIAEMQDVFDTVNQ
jgi:hypothetical protein